MRIILRYTRCRECIFFTAALLFTGLQVKLELLFPEYLRDITALIQAGTIDYGRLAVLCGQMLGFVAGSLVCAVLTVLMVSVASSKVTARIRQGVFSKIMDFSLEEVAKFSTPSLITRCTFDVMQLQMLLAASPPMLTRTLLIGVMATAGILGKNIIWTSITGGSIALMLAFIILLIFMIMSAVMRVNTLTDKLNKISLEHLTGLRVIHAYNAQDYQQKKFDGVNNSLADTNIYINNKMALIYPSVTMFMNAASLLIYFSGVFILRSGGAFQKLAAFSDMIAAVSYANQAVLAFFN